MYVEDICIEGFKSYAQRTVVPQFDKCFNAITGLNGSGKSNILDSICFVFGITNLSQVRAGNLQDLVYKQGQAGVTKATVSITFNNSDKDKSPTGYEDHEKITVTRQIVIGGRNKYMINGSTAQPSRVQDLFHSVQLNVNNPHFLIMQGRITKVLNMKPPEILSMLEEAAGTRMYENKRASALKTLEKKQTKVDEINKVLEEEIGPALEKLRKERGQYMQWKTAAEHLDRLRRFCVAWEYTRAQRLLTSAAQDQEQLQAKISQVEAKTVELQAGVEQSEEQIQALTKERELQMGSELKKLGSEADELSKLLVKETAAWTNKQDILKAEQDAAAKLEADLAKLDDQSAKKVEAMEKIKSENAGIRSELQAAEQRASQAEREYQDVQQGMATGEDGQSMTFADQLAHAKSEATGAELESKQAELKVKHLEKELVGKRKLAASKSKEAQGLEKELSKHRAAVEAAQRELEELGFDTHRAKELEEVVDRERAAVRECQEKVDILSSQLSKVDFQYKDPEARFDRSRVKGVVARLVRVKDLNTSTALEVLAGGKLYQVVVDSDSTSKALISKGQLRQRVTIIPLNRISARTATPGQLAAAKKVGGSDASLALSLVGYDQEVAAAMQYVFGAGFVCKDDETAKKVAFHNQVKMNCVTLAGDLFNPSGLLTGGSRAQSASVLTKVHQLFEAEEELASHLAALEAAEGELRSMKAAKDRHAKLSGEVEVKSHSLSLLQERVNQSEAAQLQQAVTTMEQELQQAQQTGSEAKERKVKLEAQAKSLEKEMKEFSQQREGRLKKAEQALKQAKAALAKARDAVKDMEAEVATLAADQEALVLQKEELEEQRSAGETALLGLTEEAEKLGAAVAERKEAYDQAAARLAERKQRATECDQEISKLTKEKQKLSKKIVDNNVELRKLEHKLGRLEKECEEAESRVQKLVEEYPWIPSEKQFFGQPGSDYDFDAKSPEDALEKLAVSSEEHEKMAKQVNKKAVSMFEKAEGEFNDLTGRRSIVLKDKEKIQQVINELDEKKAQHLKLTWEKVNKDFGSIFSTLLPGTMAKLQPPEGGDVLDGLEVRVAFGTVWKQSLTELSGGQRSLLALSLILALLLFKPAPIYILDEVDAALDLSHTQNIGRMIKTHFPQSQFIVVSLKEGMFNNANVIYRTKFIDGVSTVTRTVPALKDKNQQAAPANKKQTASADASKRQRKHGSKENQEPVEA